MVAAATKSNVTGSPQRSRIPLDRRMVADYARQDEKMVIETATDEYIEQALSRLGVVLSKSGLEYQQDSGRWSAALDLWDEMPQLSEGTLATLTAEPTALSIPVTLKTRGKSGRCGTMIVSPSISLSQDQLRLMAFYVRLSNERDRRRAAQ